MYRSQMRAGLLMFLAQVADLYGEMSFQTAYKRLYWPGYKPVSMVNLVRKMLREGEIKESSSGYRITNWGRRVIEDFVPVKKYAQEHWDGWWRVVLFDIPEKFRGKRDILREALNGYGYGLWQKSTYLTPHPVTNDFNKFLKEKGLTDWVICLECRQVGGLDDVQVSEKVFKISERKERWWRLVNQGEQLLNKGGKQGEKDEWINNWQKESQSDPYLPIELEGKGMREIRKEAVKLVGSHIGRGHDRGVK